MFESGPLDGFQKFLVFIIATGITAIVYLLNELRKENKK